MFAPSKSASETGFAIRRREKNSPRTEAVNIPLRNQNQEKGKGGGKVLAFHLFLDLTAPFPLQPQLSRLAFPGGGRAELGLRPRRSEEAAATPAGNTTKLTGASEPRGGSGVWGIAA